DLGAVANAKVAQGMVVEFGEFSDCSSDLSFVFPVAPQLCDRCPDRQTVAPIIAGMPRRCSCADRIAGSGKGSGGDGVGRFGFRPASRLPDRRPDWEGGIKRSGVHHGTPGLLTEATMAVRCYGLITQNGDRVT